MDPRHHRQCGRDSRLSTLPAASHLNCHSICLQLHALTPINGGSKTSVEAKQGVGQAAGLHWLFEHTVERLTGACTPEVVMREGVVGKQVWYGGSLPRLLATPGA